MSFRQEQHITWEGMVTDLNFYHGHKARTYAISVAIYAVHWIRELDKTH